MGDFSFSGLVFSSLFPLVSMSRLGLGVAGGWEGGRGGGGGGEGREYISNCYYNTAAQFFAIVEVVWNVFN